METEDTFTGQRRVARLLRQALGEAFGEADALAGYAPLYAQESLLRRADELARFMASFNFRALREAAAPQLDEPPAIASMVAPEPAAAPVAEPVPLPVDQPAISAGGNAAFVVALKADTIYCVLQRTADFKGMSLYTDTGGRDEFVDAANDNASLTTFLCRPESDLEVHLSISRPAEALGVLTVPVLRMVSA